MLLVVALPALRATQAADIVGEWRGSSICVDKVAFPACRDENVVYDVRPRSGAPDSVVLRADKVVGGAREFMGEFTFGRTDRGRWVAEFRTPRFHGRWDFGVRGASLTGTLMDLDANRVARRVATRRATA